MSIRIVQLTDIHLSSRENPRVHRVATDVSLALVVDQIRQLQQPDGIIITGDIADDGSAPSYARLREILAVLNVPVYVLPGNHDDPAVMQSCLNTDGFHYVQSTCIGDWGFVFVNSKVDGQSHGHLSAGELSSLAQNIVALGDRPILVALHHTPRAVCPALGCQLQNSAEFTAKINQFPNVKAVIAGHTHNIVEYDAGGHTQFTTPATFSYITHAPLDVPLPTGELWGPHDLDGQLQSFRILDLSSDGSIDSQVCQLNAVDD
ncbi:MAG: metallophosphoesterase [Pseudomonadales bacterium]|nr:metallophosphoesterase [Pseudomonadales bacterium]